MPLTRVDVILEDDLLSGMFELLIGKPALMSGAPGLPAREDAAMAQEKGLQLLTLPAQICAGSLSCAHEIMHRLMYAVRYLGPSVLQRVASVQG